MDIQIRTVAALTAPVAFRQTEIGRFDMFG